MTVWRLSGAGKIQQYIVKHIWNIAVPVLGNFSRLICLAVVNKTCKSHWNLCLLCTVCVCLLSLITASGKGCLGGGGECRLSVR